MRIRAEQRIDILEPSNVLLNVSNLDRKLSFHRVVRRFTLDHAYVI